MEKGLGTYIISTNKGLLTDRQARKFNLGGEILCRVRLEKLIKEKRLKLKIKKMSKFEIKPSTFFKPIGLEREIAIKTTPDEKIAFVIWTNAIKPWNLYIYHTQNSKEDIEAVKSIRIPQGVVVDVRWPKSKVKCGKLKNIMLFSGPATISVYPAEELLQKENRQELLRPLHRRNNDILSTQKKQKTQKTTKENLILNYVKDITERKSYKVFISLRGIGYRAFVSKDKKSLDFKLGYTHPINIKIPKGITVITSADKSATVGGGESQFLTFKANNKQLVTQ